ncbi:TPA: glycosyltransferase, partial [Legionella pneumophila]|nr:glycosyltransferase [Legionella pneumophila]
MTITILILINYGILIFFIFSAIIYTLIFIVSVPGIITLFNRSRYTNIYSMIDTMELPPVTIITSIYNEGNDAIKSVLSSLNTNYKNLYIILVNDGSTDNTLELLVDSFEMIKEPFIFNQKIK